MALSLPESGVLSYNSVQPKYVRLNISAKPVPDEAKRTVAYVEYTVKARFHVNAGVGTTSDDSLADLRKKLSRPGKAFLCDSKGFGRLEANVTRFKTDAAFGPWPEVLEWTPIGDNVTAVCSWSCVVRIPECEGGTVTRYQKQLMTLNWDWSVQIDERGLSTIRITGYAEIPMTRTPEDLIPDCVDEYRERIYPQMLTGFKRTDSFTVSKDKRRLDFTITDTEMPQPLPPDVVEASGTHSVESSLQMGFITWQGTIRATLTPRAGVSRGEMAEVFRAIVAMRTELALAAVNTPEARMRNARVNRVGPIVISRTPQAGAVFVTGYRAEESLFDLSSTFTVNYRIIGSSLQTILGDAGLWRVMPAHDALTWRLSNQRFRPRGVAGVRLKSTDDALIDLCVSKPPLPVGQKTPPPTPAGLMNVISERKRISPLPARGGGGDQADVKPEFSWIYFQCSTIRVENHRIARHTPLGTQGLTLMPPPLQATQAVERVAADKGTGRPDALSATQDTLQRVSNPVVRVRLEGQALRLAHPIDPPRLVSIGGVVGVLAHVWEARDVVGAVGGVPVHWAAWSITYELPSAPRTTPLAANPFLRTEGVA